MFRFLKRRDLRIADGRLHCRNGWRAPFRPVEPRDIWLVETGVFSHLTRMHGLVVHIDGDRYRIGDHRRDYDEICEWMSANTHFHPEGDWLHQHWSRAFRTPITDLIGGAVLAAVRAVLHLFQRPKPTGQLEEPDEAPIPPEPARGKPEARASDVVTENEVRLRTRIWHISRRVTGVGLLGLVCAPVLFILFLIQDAPPADLAGASAALALALTAVVVGVGFGKRRLWAYRALRLLTWLWLLATVAALIGGLILMYVQAPLAGKPSLAWVILAVASSIPLLLLPVALLHALNDPDIRDAMR